MAFSTDFDISFNGKPFYLPDPGLMERVQRWLDLNPERLIRYTGPDRGDLDFGIETPAAVEAKLYELFIPSGTVRFPTFRGLMHKDQVAVLTGTGIGSVYYDPGVGGGASLLAGTLNLRVNNSRGITKYMWMLPPQPLVGLNGVADLYLITLVGESYYAQWGTYAMAGWTWGSLGSTGSYWGDVIHSAATQALGASGYTAYGTWPPESVYGQPDIDSDFYSFGANPAYACDSALANTGRVMSGNFQMLGGAGTNFPSTVIKWTDANTIAASERSTYANDKIAGGVIYSGYGDLKTIAQLPPFVTTLFPQWIKGSGYDNPNQYINGPTVHQTDDVDPRAHTQDGEYPNVYTSQVLCTSLGSPYASIFITPSSITNSLNLTLRDTAKALYEQDLSIDATNKAKLDDLAFQLAKDFYDSQIQNVIETYRGIVPFDPRSGMDITFCVYPEPMTRVSRRPLNEYQTSFHHGFGDIRAPHREQFVKITGALSGGKYPGKLAPGGTSTLDDVWVIAVNGESLAINAHYPAIRSGTANSYSPNYPVYYVGALGPAVALTVDSTLVSGGTVNGILYTDGSTLRSASLAEIVGNQLYVQAAANKWIGFSIGSH